MSDSMVPEGSMAPGGTPSPVGASAAAGVRRMILIHGAWQGSWAFDAWVPLLREAGWWVHAVDLPGNGWGGSAAGGGAASEPGAAGRREADLSGYTEHVLALLRSIDGPVVLVGHSGGGLTASQVAEQAPERVACLVYLAGFMLPSGMSFVDLLQQCRRQHPEQSFDGIAPFLTWNTERTASEVPAEAALQIFLHDCPPQAARTAAALLRPQPESGRAMSNRLTRERFGRVPRIYVECTEDRSIALALQRSMQALSPGARRISLACGHVPQLARPAELTERLQDALADVLPLTPLPPLPLSPP